MNIRHLFPLACLAALSGCGQPDGSRPAEASFSLRPGLFSRVQGGWMKVEIRAGGDTGLLLAVPEHPDITPLPLSRAIGRWEYISEGCKVEVRVEAATRILVVQRGECTEFGFTADLGRYGITGPYALD